MQKLEVLDTRNKKECGKFCYYHCKCCRPCQKRECWLIISPILLLVFGGVVVETSVKITFIRVLVWVSAGLNLLIVSTTMIPGWEYAWLYLSKCLRHFFCFYCKYIRKYKNEERIARHDPAPSIHLTKCPPCCPCAFWPTPYQYCGTECASCVNIILDIIFGVICIILVLWKRALKADYDECMKYSTDCNKDHIENYEAEVTEWIIFLVLCIIVGIFNCCVGRNLIYYRISQAAHGDLSLSFDFEEEERERESNRHIQPSQSVEVNNDVNNDVNNEGIELTRIPNNNGSFHSQRNNNNNNNNNSNHVSISSSNQITIEVKDEEMKNEEEEKKDEEMKEEVKNEDVKEGEVKEEGEVKVDNVEGEKKEIKNEEEKEKEKEKEKETEKEKDESSDKESPKHHHKKENEEEKPSTAPVPPI